MSPCSETEGDRRQAEAEAQQLRFERAHDWAWLELQTASPASAREVWARMAALEGAVVPAMMAEALRELTAHPEWDFDAGRRAVEKMRALLRLVVDEIASGQVWGENGV